MFLKWVGIINKITVRIRAGLGAGVMLLGPEFYGQGLA